MALSPTEIVAAILDNPTDLDHVRSLVTDDVTYVSLNYDDPDLKRIMPWCGTSKGPESIVKTFVDVGRYWEKQTFAVEALFGSGEHVAMFGRFTYKSIMLGKVVALAVSTRQRKCGRGAASRASSRDRPSPCPPRDGSRSLPHSTERHRRSRRR